MTGWHRGPLLAFDLETTGPDPDTARIVTATLIALEDGTRIRGTRNYLVDPGVAIPAGATAVHGVTTEQARADGRQPDEVVAEITGEIGFRLHRGIPLVAFNAAYDLTVLDRECRRHGIDSLDTRLSPVGPVIDGHVLDKHVDPYRKGSRRLVDVAAHYGHDLAAAHTAEADAYAAVQVACAIAEKQSRVGGVDPARLHTLQTTWRAEQSASLQAYFRRKDPDAVVCGDWPVQALPAGWDPRFHPVDEPLAAAS